jgi:hypothetical protein
VSGVKLWRAIKVSRHAAQKWKVKGECCLVRISKRGLKLLVKVGFQVVCSVTTQTRPPTFTTAVVIFDAPNSCFGLCSFVVVVFFLDRDRRQKSKNMFALRSRSSPRQLLTWVTHFSNVQITAADNSLAIQLANTFLVTPTRNPSSNCPKANYTSSVPDRSKATRNSSSKTLLPRSDAPARNFSTNSSSNAYTKKAKQNS